MTASDNPQTLWTSSFIKICLVNFFIFVNFHALLPTFPFFITHLGGDAVAIGLATALFSIASILSRPFAGWLVDTKGRCVILIAGLVGMSLIPMGYFVSAGVAMAVILRTIHGAFHAASSNASSTWVTDIVPRVRMGEGLGMYGLSMALSTAVAPALGLTLMNTWGFQPLFAAAALSTLIALLLGVSIRNRGCKPSPQPLKMGELFERMSLPASVTQFFFMMAYGVVEVYVAIYAASCHLPSGGIYFICIALSTVASRLLLGKAIDTYGEGLLVLSGNAAIIAGILLLVLAPNAPCYILSALLLGYSFGAIQPSLQTMAIHAVAPERRGAANSTFFVSFDLGIALGGFLAGCLVKQWGYDIMFLVISLFCLCSGMYYWMFARNHPSSFNPSARRREQMAAAALERQAGSPQPFIVTLSREYGSGGRHIGELLAQKLGVKLYDRQLIDMTARQSGLGEEVVEQNEELTAGRLMYENPTQSAVFHAQSRIIRQLAEEAPCVIVGRLSNFVLKNHPRCFSAFVYADEEYRLERVVNLDGVSREEAAEKLRTADRRRREYCRHYTGCEWGERHHYHLMVDSSQAGEEATAELLYNIVKEKF